MCIMCIFSGLRLRPTQSSAISGPSLASRASSLSSSASSLPCPSTVGPLPLFVPSCLSPEENMSQTRNKEAPPPMGISENRGTRPKYCNPLKEPPKQGTPLFGNPHMATGRFPRLRRARATAPADAAALAPSDSPHAAQEPTGVPYWDPYFQGTLLLGGL